MLEFLQLTPTLLLIILVAGFFTAVLHGATGMAGGIVMTAILSLILGVKAAIPAMTCTLILSHASRMVFNAQAVDWRLASRVLAFGLPGVVLGALVFGTLNPSAVALIMALFLMLSFPVKRFTRRRQLTIGPKTLAVGSASWGFLAGNVIGPGFVLAPFLLATGMSRHTFVGTLATIVLVMNLVKVTVFSATELLDSRLFVIGTLVGIMSIPGNYYGREVLRKITDSDHHRIIDFMTVLIILNFIYIAVREANLVP